MATAIQALSSQNLSDQERRNEVDNAASQARGFDPRVKDLSSFSMTSTPAVRGFGINQMAELASVEVERQIYEQVPGISADVVAEIRQRIKHTATSRPGQEGDRPEDPKQSKIKDPSKEQMQIEQPIAAPHELVQDLGQGIDLQESLALKQGTASQRIGSSVPSFQLDPNAGLDSFSIGEPQAQMNVNRPSADTGKKSVA
ncbi:MAG: hypothetical protein J5J00_07490 [Deltaproteobacteria bacterium]|nr:hypothetical protein [Deltaproteobacteria bacterium]